MPSYKFNTPSDAPRSELLTGDYPFQVVGVDFSLCPFGKEEKGSDMMGVKVAFFKDATFTQKLAQWTENIVFHAKWEWKLHQFTASAGMMLDGRLAKPGDDIDYSETSVVGLRGWAKLKPEQDKNDKDKRYNRVWVWITDKEKLPKFVDVSAPADEFGDEPPPF